MDALNVSTGSTGYVQVPESAWEPKREKKKRKGRSQFLEGERRAVLIALTAARLCLDGGMTLKAAAHAVGTKNVPYVHAVLVLLKAEAFDTLDRVINGEESLLAAAANCRKLAKALAAYREVDRYYNLHCEFLLRTGLYADLGQHLINSSPIMRVEAARAVGADAIWDSMIAPLVS